MDKQKTSIQISKKLAKKLRMWKAELELDTIEEVLDTILIIPTANQIPQINSDSTPLSRKGGKTA